MALQRRVCLREKSDARNAQRLENVFLHVLLESLARQFLKHLSSPGNSGAVRPALAWLVEQRPVKDVVNGAAFRGWLAGILGVLLQFGVHKVVASAGAMGEEQAQRNVFLAPDEDRRPVLVEPGENRLLGEERHMFRDVLVEPNGSTLMQLQ